MSRKLFISRVRYYATPGTSEMRGGRKAEPQGKFSAGIAVADRLNGDEELVGTFDPNDNRPIKVGFITFREKFQSEDEAREFVAEKRKRYKVGTFMKPENWHWGRADEELTNAYREARGGFGENATVHIVKFGRKDMPVDPSLLLAGTDVAAVASQEAEQMLYKGQVTEPV